MPELAIIVPTYRRPESLLQCLGSLQQQTTAAFEVLVTDNAADPAIERRVADFNRTARIPARYVAVPPLGLHNARHAGARASQAAVLIFTDDDATFTPGFIQAYAEAFAAHPEMAAASGPVRPVWEKPPPPWLSDYMRGLGEFPILSLRDQGDQFTADAQQNLYGVNMAVRRDVLFAFGGFNPECYADQWLGDGETGLQRKLQKARKIIGYVPGAAAFHHIPAERMTLRYFRRRMENEGASHMYAKYHYNLAGRGHFARDAFWEAWLRFPLWLGAIGMGWRMDRFAIDMKLSAALSLARFRYLVRLCASGKLRELVAHQDWLNDDPELREDAAPGAATTPGGNGCSEDAARGAATTPDGKGVVAPPCSPRRSQAKTGGANSRRNR